MESTHILIALFAVILLLQTRRAFAERRSPSEPGGTIECQRLVITDEDGRPCVELEAGSHGGEFIIRGDDNALRVRVGVGGYGGEVTLYSSDGKPRLDLEVSPDGGSVSLRGTNERAQVGLGAASGARLGDKGKFSFRGCCFRWAWARDA